MKHTIRRRVTALLALSALLISVTVPGLAAGAGTVVYRTSASLAEDVAVTHTTSLGEDTDLQQSASVLTLPSDSLRFKAVWGDGVRQGDTILEISEWAQARGMTVVAGVNADFFDMATGSPLGILVSDGILYSSDAGNAAVGFTQDGTVIVGDPALRLCAQNQRTGAAFEIHHYNKEPGEWVFDLLSRDYASTLTLSGSWLIAEVSYTDRLCPGGSTTLRVETILTVTDGSYTIPEDRMILITKADGAAAWYFGYFAEGDELLLEVTCGDPRFAGITEACGCGDILIRDGAITDETTWNSLGSENPRTALGILEDGSVLLYTVDGGQPGRSAGLSLRETAEELLSLGCVTAVNLDGGGSTAMVVRGTGNAQAELANVPEVSSLRRCAVYLLLVSDRISDGIPAVLSASCSGEAVLPGSRLDLGTISASDAGFSPTEVPEDTMVRILSGSGALLNTADGTVSSESVPAASAALLAGGQTGEVVLSLQSPSTGACGTAVIRIPETVTELTLKPTSESVAPGESLSVLVSASYYGHSVTVEPISLDWSVDGDCTISDEGILSVPADWSGSDPVTLTATYGSATASVTIRIDRPEEAAEETQAPSEQQNVSSVGESFFADVSGHWAEDDILRLAAAGIANGSLRDGVRVFDPDAYITRQELCVMLARVAALDLSDYHDTELPFADVDQIADWAVDSVRALYVKGWMTGSGSGDALYANPTDPVTRSEICTILMRLLNVTPLTDSIGSFADADTVPDWAVQGIQVMLDLEIVSGFEDNTLRPTQNTTRAQVARLLRGMV